MLQQNLSIHARHFSNNKKTKNKQTKQSLKKTKKQNKTKQRRKMPCKNR
jgi:hypothetical protein